MSCVNSVNRPEAETLYWFTTSTDFCTKIGLLKFIPLSSPLVIFPCLTPYVHLMFCVQPTTPAVFREALIILLAQPPFLLDRVKPTQYLKDIKLEQITSDNIDKVIEYDKKVFNIYDREDWIRDWIGIGRYSTTFLLFRQINIFNEIFIRQSEDTMAKLF